MGSGEEWRCCLAVVLALWAVYIGCVNGWLIRCDLRSVGLFAGLCGLGLAEVLVLMWCV